MKIIGVILILWGIADFGLSWIDRDLYLEIGINVPDWLWQWTAWIAIGIGSVIFSLGKPNEEEEEEEEEA